MTVTEQDLELMRIGYALWNEGDIAGLVERCLADDVEFHPDPGWPGPQVVRGADAVRAFLDEVATVIGLTEVNIEHEAVVGDEVLFSLRTKVAGEQSGVHLEVPVFHLAHFEGGRVTRVMAFLDEGAATQALVT